MYTSLVIQIRSNSSLCYDSFMVIQSYIPNYLSFGIITTLPKGGLLHGYKPRATDQHLKALASLVLSHIAFATLSAPPQGTTVLLAILKRVLMLFYAYHILHDVMFVMLAYVFGNGRFILLHCPYIVHFSPKKIPIIL